MFDSCLVFLESRVGFPFMVKTSTGAPIVAQQCITRGYTMAFPHTPSPCLEISILAVTDKRYQVGHVFENAKSHSVQIPIIPYFKCTVFRIK